MNHEELLKYIQDARAKQVPDDAIKALLVKSGWSASLVDEALAPAAAHDMSLPPPPVPHVGMWVSFQYVILFIALYISATALGGILHYAVDKLIADPLDNTSYYGSNFNEYLMKGYLAALIVSYPIFAFLFVKTRKQILATPFIKSLKARKLLIYITLIVTFIIMISYIIGTVYSFFDGSVTGRTLAHLGVTLLVAGSIFGYLLLDVKEDRKSL